MADAAAFVGTAATGSALPCDVGSAGAADAGGAAVAVAVAEAVDEAADDSVPRVVT